MKVVRIVTVGFLWVVATGSLISYDFLTGLVAFYLMIIGATYSEFDRRKKANWYWLIMAVGMVIVIILLYQAGLEMEN